MSSFAMTFFAILLYKTIQVHLYIVFLRHGLIRCSKQHLVHYLEWTLQITVWVLVLFIAIELILWIDFLVDRSRIKIHCYFILTLPIQNQDRILIGLDICVSFSVLRILTCHSLTSMSLLPSWFAEFYFLIDYSLIGH